MHRVNTFSVDTLANWTSPEWGVVGSQHMTLETAIPATGSPTGAWTLERYGLDGSWATHDIGAEAFTDPAAGAATGQVNVKYAEPGRYRLLYTRTSGGAAVSAGAQARVHVRDA